MAAGTIRPSSSGAACGGHTTARRPVGADHEHVAVEPFRAGSAVPPHTTSHAAPTQLRTVHSDAGHVTWHSGLDPQSTSHDDAPLHSTWQYSPAAQPTSHDV